jgi:hypothetical protein
MHGFVSRGCPIMTVSRSVRSVLVSALLLGGATAVSAQSQPYPDDQSSYQQDDGPPGYGNPQTGQAPPAYGQGQGYHQSYGQGYPPPQQQQGAQSAQGYAAPPPPPPGYDGSQPPPPPPGYQAGPDDARQQAQDQQYAAYTQQWAQANCVRAHADTGAGAVIGGAAGALLGSGLAGRHDRGTGALLGAGVGALGGAAVANNTSSGATSPGCPPGYVTRSGAPAFAYGGGYAVDGAYAAQPAYAYAAPTWYQPWVYYGGAWTYRPYPYHVWYYRHYYRPGFYYGRPGPYRYGWRRRW